MLKKIIQKVRENQNKLLLGIFGAVTLSGLAYLAYRSYSRFKQEKSHIQAPSEHDINEAHEGQERQEGPKLNVNNEEINNSLIRVVNNVKNAVKNSQDFAFQAVKAIYQGYHELSNSQFKKLAFESRRLRRQSFKDIKRYKDILIDYENRIEAVRTKCLTSILQFFKLQPREWYVLVEKYSQECRQPWEQIVILTDVKQLSTLRQSQKSPIHPEIMIQIFEYKLEVFEQVLQAASTLYPDRGNNQLYSFVDRRLSDIVHQKYGTEDEDIFFSMVVIGSSAKHKIEQIEQRINAQLQFFVTGPYSDK